MLLTEISWAECLWALPFLTVLCPSECFYQERKRRHQTLVERVWQLIQLLSRWLPTRPKEAALEAAERRGDLRFGKRLLAIFALRDSHSPQTIAAWLKVSVDSVLDWAKYFLYYKLKGPKEKSHPGAKPNSAKRKSVNWPP